MRVCCGACGAKYRVADELVVGRRINLRCRRCGGVIPVGERPSEMPARPKAPPPPPPVPTWFVAAAGELAGPFFFKEIERGIRCGELFADDHLWQAGTRDWLPVGRVPEIMAVLNVAELGTRPPPAVLVPPPASPSLPAPAAPMPRRVASSSPGKRTALWIWLTTAGAVIVALSAVLVLLQRRSKGVEQQPRDDRTPPPIAIHIGQAEIRIAPSDEATAEVQRLPAFEIKLDRQRRASRDGGATRGSPDGGLSILRRVDQRNVLAQRLFRRSEGAFVACARLAERRGANLEGRAAEFVVEVDEGGKPRVTVKGDGLSAQLARCYRAIISTWELPATGQPYRLMFRRLH